MSTFGAPQEIRTEFVVDLDSYRRGLNDAKREGLDAGRTVGEAMRDGLRVAADAAIVVTSAVRTVQGAYERVSDAVDRLAERAANDPGVKAFQRVQEAAGGLFDDLVEGALKSQTVQTALHLIGNVLETLSEKAGGVGEAIDRFATAIAPSFKRAITPLLVGVGLLTDGVKILGGTFTFISGLIAQVGAKVLDFVSKVLDGASQASKGLSETLAESLATASSAVERAKNAVAAFGDNQVTRGLKTVGDAFDSATGRAEQMRTTLERLFAVFSAPPAGDTPEAAPLGPTGPSPTERTRDAIVGAVDDLAHRIAHSFEQPLQRIAGMFRELGADMKNSLDPAQRAVADAAGSAFAGLGTLARQVEGSLDRGSAAAKVFQRVQMGLQAAMAGVKAAMSFGEALAENARGNPGAAALYTAAGATFLTAASLSGAQAITGGFGAGGGGGIGGQRIDAGRSVERQNAEINIYVEGNIVGNEEYLLNTVVPGLRRLVEEQDVVVVASHSSRAGQLGGL